MAKDEKYKAQYAYIERNPELYKNASRKYYHTHKEECAERAKKWRETNKDYVREKQREKKRQRKCEAIEYLGGKCADCGNIYHQAVYEFHHTDPSTKGRDPSKLLQLSWERIKAELDKCVLLCANCHRMRHHDFKVSDQ